MALRRRCLVATDLQSGNSTPTIRKRPADIAAAAESVFRQYRAVRWLLLPEAELRPRRAATLDCKAGVTKGTKAGVVLN